MHVPQDSEIYQNFRKAGRIAAKARIFGRSLIKPGVSLLEVTEAVENKILDLGAGMAFPPQISLNSTAAHNCADDKDPTVFSEGDLIKLDVGAHVEGAIGDTATTIYLGSNQDEGAKLQKAADAALAGAVKALRAGVSPGEIGAAIEAAVKGFEGCTPVKNLCGHGLGIYKIHTPPSIPNYDTGSRSPLNETVVAIEPFVTTGVGMIYESGAANIFMISGEAPIRMPETKKIFNYLKSEYGTLPFTTRWLLKKFPAFQAKMALQQLVSAGVLTAYPPLVEKSKALVAQAEFTVYIGEKSHVLTIPDDD